MSIHEKLVATQADVDKLRKEVKELKKIVNDAGLAEKTNQATGAKGGDGKA